MARIKDKIKAIEMREKGLSYSQIQKELKVSKSTLSSWLYQMPLTREQINLLRGKNPKRIEQFRETMRIKRENRLSEVLSKAKIDIDRISDRELFIAGLFLYWGEGTKAQRSCVALTNTNPGILNLYIKWLELFTVEKRLLKVRLHLYSDMDIADAIQYWSEVLNIPVSQFRKPYIKTSTRGKINYGNSFKMGTCSVVYGSTSLWEYIMMCLKVLGNYK